MINLSKLNHCINYCFLASSILLLVACDQGMNEQHMLLNAKNYVDQGDLVAASIELRNTLNKNTENAEARYLLGSISLEAGDLASAEKEFRRAALAGWDKEQTQIGLARIFILRKEFQKLLDEIVIIDTWSPATRANISALRALAEAGLGHTPQAKTALAEGSGYKADAFHVLKTTAMFQLSGILDGDASSTLSTAHSLFPENSELLMLDATNDIHNGNNTRAAETFRKIISLDSVKFITFNGRRALIGLARLQINDKNYSGATATLAPLLKRNDRDPEAIFLNGLLAFDQGDYPRAEDHIRKLLTIAPDNNQSHQLMGKIKYELNNFDQAADHLSIYLNANPDDVETRKQLTNIYIMLNQLQSARLTLQAALTLQPDDVGTLSLLSQIEFNSGDLKAGIQTLNKAIKSSPDNAALHKQLARAYIANGETGLALQELKIFQRLSNDTEEAQRLTISAYLQAGEKNKAINVANTMLEQNPENAAILALNGSLYAAVNNRQQARKYFNKALELEKNQPAATIGLARIETEENHLDRATELYNGLIESSTGGAIPMLALANLAAQQKDNNGMLSWLERARNTSPSEIQSRIILANYYLRNNQPKNAEIYIKEAIKVSPENAELLALYGKALIAQKRYGDALLPLNRLVNNLPESTEARILLGETFLHQDMTDSAREHLQKALQIHNDLMPAMILMAEIEFKEGKYDKSMEYAKKLQKKQPRLYIGYMQEGDIWMARQDNNRALSAYSNAWNLAHSAELSKRLYFASRNSAGFQEAIKPLLSWLNDHPEDSSIRLFLATIYQGAKADVDAIREYEKVLLQTPDNVTALNNLAWLFSLTNNPKALDLAERAYRAAPENIGVLDTYGWVLVQQGQAEKGQHLIKKAMERLPDNLEIRYHYATALIKSGNEEEGRQMLEALLKQDKPFIGKNEAQQLLGKQKASR